MGNARYVLWIFIMLLGELGYSQVLPLAFYKGNVAVAPSFISVSTARSADSVTSVTITKPASVQAGDLLIVWFAKNNTAAVTPPSGWTLQASLGGAYGQVVFTKLATATEVAAANFVFTWTGSADTTDRHAIILNYRGVHQTNPVTVANSNSGTNTTATYLGGTTLKPRSLAVSICTSGSMPGTPTGFTSRNSAAWATRAADKVITPQGPTGNFTSTASNPWGSFLLIISPP